MRGGVGSAQGGPARPTSRGTVRRRLSRSCRRGSPPHLARRTAGAPPLPGPLLRLHPTSRGTVGTGRRRPVPPGLRPASRGILASRRRTMGSDLRRRRSRLRYFHWTRERAVPGARRLHEVGPGARRRLPVASRANSESQCCWGQRWLSGERLCRSAGLGERLAVELSDGSSDRHRTGVGPAAEGRRSGPRSDGGGSSDRRRSGVGAAAERRGRGGGMRRRGTVGGGF